MALATRATVMELVDFEAARKRADERLNQELVRIRNLPKKSKIKICNKHGLNHAHHMNTGLVKGLEIDLDVIHRERRRVVNEMNKRKKVFTTTTKRSFPDLLPVTGHEKQGVPNHMSPKRFHTTWNPNDYSDTKSQEIIAQEELRKERLLRLTERSKQRTEDLINSNYNKLRLSPDPGIGPFVTRLNNRGVELRKSCFPSLLGQSNPGIVPNRMHAQYNGTLGSIHEKWFPNGQSRPGSGRFREIVNEKVILPSIKSKLHTPEPRLRKVVLMATKRKTGGLAGDIQLGKNTSAFTKHWM
ncbi:uncharacterized protein LOC5516979 [Nematostella vectensis]|uniref:uncharacterized protein LOC5516979 n=1 Tax=Nematostella vectensis TaxID=45351 RepID=UPI002076E39B|nr:uncharacterized protein LOC5516979 [Nematostella vectensis]